MNTAGNIPSPSAPFLSDDGRISQVWWQFLVSLFSRTGSGQGVDAADLKSSIADLLMIAEQGDSGRDDALRSRVADLEALLDASAHQAALPSGYVKAMVAGVARTIPYY